MLVIIFQTLALIRLVTAILIKMPNMLVASVFMGVHLPLTRILFMQVYHNMIMSLEFS